ncbi:LacI family DNA-binding transcriptional regulator [Isoptericola sp. b441]|uniref:LacI family DNA-binding transcriptional regulator n=1 Tax=Actinotalea lenta TaxID=3064654 RepID=A0ABT9DD21_9CELL|nr:MULTISPECIES: LacI family DNA-binding transcriptional regulator [unclassified Isoptericola]MDO8108520.1 LacI family DNA-binding transcriptional regulator [Isoptericola sp. b441]MDO8119930.1 LacI family DNA-binding transcriptional regulator [Isoptericola sp. b490]
MTDLRRPRASAPTIRQVAAAAGVSRATASRVINGGHLVSPTTKAAVEAAIAELGFTPNPVARSLATRRTGSVALVVPEPNTRLLTDPFFGNIINGLSLALEEADLQMLLLIARDGSGTRRASRYLTTGHVDGAVVASHHRDDALNRELVASGLPSVFIGRPLDVEDAHYIDIDNVLGARLATEHLLGLGRRHVATIAGPADMTAGIDRLVGWRQAMESAGLPTDGIAYGDFTTNGGTYATEQLLAEHPELDAIFCASDVMAASALTVLSSHGRRVPEDVAVMGFDDLEVAESTRPPLSTVSQPVAQMAARAGRMLIDLIAHPDKEPEHALLTARVVLRASA